MITPTKAKEQAEKFIDEYLTEPHKSYIGPISSGPIKNVSYPNDVITRIRNRKIVNGKLPTKPNKDDNLEDWCLIIGIRKKLSPDIELPSEYNGVKVFYYKCGEVIHH